LPLKFSPAESAAPASGNSRPLQLSLSHGRRLEATLRPRQAHPQRPHHDLRSIGPGRAAPGRRSCRRPSHGRLPTRSSHPLAPRRCRRRTYRHPRALRQPPTPPPRIRRRSPHRTPRRRRTRLVSPFRAKTPTGRPTQIPAPPSQATSPSEHRIPTLELASHPLLPSLGPNVGPRDLLFPKKRIKTLRFAVARPNCFLEFPLPSPFSKMCYRYPFTP
jgi:hypothetical protein